MNYFIAALIGLVSGITSAVFGVGGGLIMVPAMMYFLTPPIRDIKQAIGTSLVVIIPTAAVGAWLHYQKNPDTSNVNWSVAVALAPTAIAGSIIGAKLIKIISTGDLKRAFGAFVILVGIKLLFFK